jgi:hypothetical protein
VFELLKWNGASIRGLDEVAHMTLLFMMACYACEWNTSMDTPIYTCSLLL